jgi:chromosome segregation ATPase
MEVTMEGLLLMQVRQENALLHEELATAKDEMQRAQRAEREVFACLDAERLKVQAAEAEALAAREAVAQVQKSWAQDVSSNSADAASKGRIAALEAQLASCEASFSDRMTSRMVALDGEVEELRERCALSEGKAQAALHEAHAAELRAQTQQSRAEQFQRALEEMREELARTAEEAATARSAAAKAERNEATAMETAAHQVALLEKRLAEAEERRAVAPIERDEAIAALRRSYRDVSARLHERTVGVHSAWLEHLAPACMLPALHVSLLSRSPLEP